MSKPEAPEFQIERDYDNRCAHARSMYHMAVQRAEAELDVALSTAYEVRQGELADLRHNAYKAYSRITPTLEDVAMVKRELDQPYGVTRMAEMGSRKTEIQP